MPRRPPWLATAAALALASFAPHCWPLAYVGLAALAIGVLTR